MDLFINREDELEVGLKKSRIFKMKISNHNYISKTDRKVSRWGHTCTMWDCNNRLVSLNSYLLPFFLSILHSTISTNPRLYLSSSIYLLQCLSLNLRTLLSTFVLFSSIYLLQCLSLNLRTLLSSFVPLSSFVLSLICLFF